MLWEKVAAFKFNFFVSICYINNIMFIWIQGFLKTMTTVVYAMANRYEERNENFLDLFNYTDIMSEFEDK